jgi:hypothetical protein
MLWAITCYFNPCAYQRRRDNYRRFRESLTLPLMTVEQSFDGRFELGPDDADVLIPLRGGSVMWQKERLLNIATDNLPAECRRLVWIDCDMIVLDPEWIDKVEAALDRHRLVQPFAEVVLLRRDEQPSDRGDAEGFRSQAFAKFQVGLRDADVPSLSDCRLAGYSPGGSWAFDRDFAKSCGLYDALILGAADAAMAQAAVGRAQEFVTEYDLTPAHSDHYLEWSGRYHRECGGEIGFVDSDIFHLWHGDLFDRGYDKRYKHFSRFDFNPNTDLVRDPATKCLCWNSPKPELHRYVREYFSQRREDG